MGMTLFLYLLRGIPLGLLLPPRLNIAAREQGEYLVAVLGTAVFGNWLMLRRRLLELPGARRIVLDLSQTVLVDHTVMVKLAQLQADFADRGGELELTGFDGHSALSGHPLAARLLRHKPSVSTQVV
jgi:MFS superfamily sulfate permease-like transporter